MHGQKNIKLILQSFCIETFHYAIYLCVSPQEELTSTGSNAEYESSQVATRVTSYY